jgi:hypothetical protein
MPVTKAVSDALQVLQQALEQVDPKVPEGVEPWKVEGWVDLSQAWVGWNMVAGYFGLQLPDDEEDAETPQPQPQRRGGHARDKP